MPADRPAPAPLTFDPTARGPLTRRAVLLGGASMVAIAACSKGGSTATKDGSAATSAPATSSLLAFFPISGGYLTAGVAQRIAFGVAGPGGTLNTETPTSLRFTVTGPKGTTSIDVAAHRDGLPWSYYPMSYTPTVEGNYEVSTKVDGQEVTASFNVGAKGSSEVPGPGDEMPALVTPTTDKTLGVDPICTQDPPCPLHTVSLDAALAQGKPVAYLVATPKFCQTGICGPVLQVLESVRAEYADRVTFIHQEVYQSASEAAEKGANATLTKAVQELKLPSEPVLFLIDENGTLRHRLDAAYDKRELRDGLDGLIG